MTIYRMVDGSGVIRLIVESEEPPAAQTGLTVVSAPLPDTAIAPTWNGSAWIEGDLTGKKAAVKARIDAEAEAKFFGLLGGNLYIAIAHLMKGFEAIDYWNDNIRAAEVSEKRPRSYRALNATSTKERPIIDAESAARGVPVATLVQAILPLSDVQWNLIRDIEAKRPVAKDAVSAATDSDTVDSVYAQWQTDLAAITIP